MSNKERFLLGGAGGIAPVVVGLIVVDLQILLVNLTIVAVIAYMIRVTALFLLGGFMAWIHKKESEPWKLVQLGIAAPAVAVAILNGSNVPVPEVPAEKTSSASSFLVSSSYAQDQASAKVFTYPRESTLQQLKRGLWGATPRNVYFVVADAFPTMAEAERHARELQARGVTSEVYAPFGSNPNYSVVVGSHLALEEARLLRETVVSNRVANNAYVWTFPPK